MECEKLTLADLGKPILPNDALKEEESPIATIAKQEEKCSSEVSTNPEESPLPNNPVNEEGVEKAILQVDPSDEGVKEEVAVEVETPSDMEPIKTADQETETTPEVVDDAESKKEENLELETMEQEEANSDEAKPLAPEQQEENVVAAIASDEAKPLAPQQVEANLEEVVVVNDAESKKEDNLELEAPEQEGANAVEVITSDEVKPLATEQEESAEAAIASDEAKPLAPQQVEAVIASDEAKPLPSELQAETNTVEVFASDEAMPLSSDNSVNGNTEAEAINEDESGRGTKQEESNETALAQIDTESDQICVETEAPAVKVEETGDQTVSDEADAPHASEDFASDATIEKSSEREQENQQELKESSSSEKDDLLRGQNDEITATLPSDHNTNGSSVTETVETVDINTDKVLMKSCSETYSAHQITESKENPEPQIGATEPEKDHVEENEIAKTATDNTEDSDIHPVLQAEIVHEQSQETTAVENNSPASNEQSRETNAVENNSATSNNIDRHDGNSAKEKKEIEPVLTAPQEIKVDDVTEELPREQTGPQEISGTLVEANEVCTPPTTVDESKLHNSRPEPDGYRPDPSDDDSCLRHFTESTELAAKVDNVQLTNEPDSAHSSKPDPPPDPPAVLQIEHSSYEEPSNYADETESPATEETRVEENPVECQKEQEPAKSDDGEVADKLAETKDFNTPQSVEQSFEQNAVANQATSPAINEQPNVETCSKPRDVGTPVSKVSNPQAEVDDEYEEEILDESEVSYEEILIDEESEADEYFEEILEDEDEDDLFTEETYDSRDEKDTDFITAGNSAEPAAEGRRSVARTKSADELGRRTVVRNKSIREKELEQEIARKREEALQLKKNMEYRIARQNSFAEKDFDFLRKLAEEEEEHIREEEERERKRQEEEAEMARIKAEEAALLIAQQEKEELRKRLMEEEERRKAAEAEAHRLAAERAAQEKEALEKARREFEEEERRKREEKKREMEAEVRALQAKLEEAKRAALEAKKKQKEEKERLRAKVEARRKIKKEKPPRANDSTENVVAEANPAMAPKSPEKSTTPAVVEISSPEKMQTPAVSTPGSPMKSMASEPAPRSPVRSPKKAPVTMQVPDLTPATAQPVVTPASPSPKKAPVEKTPVASPPPPEEPAKEIAKATENVVYYSVEQLRKQSVPGLDYKNREKYLSPEDFVAVLGVTKAEFDTYPKWKQTNLKRKNKLF